MERLKKDLRSMIAHVSGLQGVPTTEQLVSKCAALSDAIIKSAIGLSYRITSWKSLRTNSFAAMGWDLHHKLVTNADHFTADGLLAELH